MRFALPVGLSAILAVPALLAALAPAPAAAQLGFDLERAGIELATSDRDLLRQNVLAALQSGPGAQPTSWANEETGLSGRARSIEALEVDGRACQRVALELTRRDRQARYRLVLCRRDDGRWAIAG
ncbi:MAG: RT0821/Lpp0805 family surface protein [Azospirillaceae bacterium]